MSSNHASRSSRADEALEQLGRLSLRGQPLEALLQRVVDLSKSVLPGDPEASIYVRVQNRPSTMVSTGELATALDEVQYSQDAGPCLHAAATGELVEILDTRIESRWAEYSRRAAEHGNLSSLSVPLAIDDDMIGALNIYARRPRAFDEDSKAEATRFGPYAAVALGNIHAYSTARDLADNLQAAIESRAVIDQAKGILMERHKLTADQAFQLLAQVSMRTNTKVREIADTLVHTGVLPSPDGPGETSG
ncbi:GAF and ANTAR domain-containing protein [Candidatus Blastococcus massiliensis]|uniref:GAF and ANTAR domain-containing protein n=1 Tax=Candidatus Blastococcus massiliensis TaxID=1470358 RepID=UPI0004BB1E5E|nr:GAF and ANTAR domain-containing protein [Candidatus Blastococcus massiliensis]